MLNKIMLTKPTKIAITIISVLIFLLLLKSIISRESPSSTVSNLQDTIGYILQRKAYEEYYYELLALKPNDYLYAYVNLPLSYDYGSNSIPLTFAGLIAPEGDFLELGMGLYSTAILHKIAHDRKHNLVSVDTNYEWMKKFTFYNSTSFHRLFYLPTKEDLLIFGLNQMWSLVLVDHSFANLRPKSVIAFAKKAQIVIAHDTERLAEGGYQFEKNNIREHFMYVCKFSIYSTKDKKVYVSTTILSNYIDVASILRRPFENIDTDFGHVSCDTSL